MGIQVFSVSGWCKNNNFHGLYHNSFMMPFSYILTSLVMTSYSEKHVMTSSFGVLTNINIPVSLELQPFQNRFCSANFLYSTPTEVFFGMVYAFTSRFAIQSMHWTIV
ncbi:hypothetical protein DESC_260008 [Desulfosarcina cetonica]|nr:hypothetical protein DESC_260008 [Desulfosarcina cetonica]